MKIRRVKKDVVEVVTDGGESRTVSDSKLYALLGRKYDGDYASVADAFDTMNAEGSATLEGDLPDENEMDEGSLR